MVGISDGNNDGRFKIQRGQGISQAIATELGLNAQQCRKLGSVWNEIFKEVDKQNQQTKIYSGGNDPHGPTNQNYVVHTNQMIEFSKEIWAKIIQLVNEKLGTNIQVTEGAAPQTANDPSVSNPPARNNPTSNAPSAAPTTSNPPARNDAPAPVKVSTAGIAPKIPTTPYLTEAPDVSAAVKQLKGETQSNWAVSSKMKSALNTVNKNNVAYFIKEYNQDGSDIVTDIDGCTGWNKKDIYEKLTKPLMARAKELGIDISAYDLQTKSVKYTHTVGAYGVTQQYTQTDYPSLNTQCKFLNEVSATIESAEEIHGPQIGFLKKYKPQIDKANATIKKFADAPAGNITLTKPANAQNGEYTLSLGDKSVIKVKVENGKLTELSVKNSTSPDAAPDLKYDLDYPYIYLDPDEKSNGSEFKAQSNYIYSTYLDHDKIVGVATNLLKKMGVEVAE